MSKGLSTIGTILRVGTAAASVSQIGKIKSYPALGGEPEAIDTTDLEDTMTTSVPGVQQLGTMAFTANYDLTEYLSYKALEGKDLYFELDFGDDGATSPTSYGVASWQGSLTINVNEGSVNGVREMTINVLPSTIITIDDGT